MIVSYSKYKKLCDNRNYIIEKFSHEINELLLENEDLKAENERLKSEKEGLKAEIEWLNDLSILDALQRIDRGEFEKPQEPPEFKFIALKVRENFAEIYEECIEKIKASFPVSNKLYQYWEIHEVADKNLNEMKKELQNLGER